MNVLRPRIYISSPADSNLSQAQLKLKRAIIKLLEKNELDPQEFHVSGLVKNQSWSFERSVELMHRCQGALILAFSQQTTTATPPLVMTTEYAHYEGAIGITLQKEMFIIKEESVAPRGIANQGGGEFILSIPPDATTAWLTTPQFLTQFTGWKDRIASRHHVFFGYCGAAEATANKLTVYLTSLGVRVRNWRIDFRPANTILEEIEEAARKCLAGIFLFSGDDELLKGDTTQAAPRDNVIFEAGFFMHAVGRRRSLIIREGQAKMPADVGGSIYLTLDDRNNTSSIETSLRKFIETQI